MPTGNTCSGNDVGLFNPGNLDIYKFDMVVGVKGIDHCYRCHNTEQCKKYMKSPLKKDWASAWTFIKYCRLEPQFHSEINCYNDSNIFSAFEMVQRDNKIFQCKGFPYTNQQGRQNFNDKIKKVF